MSVVSVAIVISFHLKSQPTSVEKRIALPVGLVFWLLSLACLVSGFANYVKTVTKYSRRQALVQSGWKTQVVGRLPSIEYEDDIDIEVLGVHYCLLLYSGGLRLIFVH